MDAKNNNGDFEELLQEFNLDPNSILQDQSLITDMNDQQPQVN
jgi:hypothetical protein